MITQSEGAVTERLTPQQCLFPYHKQPCDSKSAGMSESPDHPAASLFPWSLSILCILQCTLVYYLKSIEDTKLTGSPHPNQRPCALLSWTLILGSQGPSMTLFTGLHYPDFTEISTLYFADSARLKPSQPHCLRPPELTSLIVSSAPPGCSFSSSCLQIYYYFSLRGDSNHYVRIIAQALCAPPCCLQQCSTGTHTQSKYCHTCVT